MSDAGELRPTDGDDEPEPSRDRPSGRPFALLLVALIAAWNAYTAFTAQSSRDAVPPTLFVAGTIALGAAMAGPEHLRIAAFFVGAAFCLAAFATAV